jgi:hypothetical protein
VVSRALTLAEVSALPAVTSLVTAGRALGLGRTKSYDLARAGKFPCPVIRAGSTWLVPTAGLLELLGLPVPAPAALDRLRRAAGGCTGPSDSTASPARWPGSG